MEKKITSKLGFGLMRLPTVENGDIDKIQTEKMIDIALQNNINYFDTAYFYHKGESETAIGELLCQRKPREEFILTDKMPMSMVETKDDLERIFNEQLERCKLEYFDYYLLHALNKTTFEKVKETDAVAFLKEKQGQGLIKHIGFSFHDTADVLKEIIEYSDWEFVQIQLNYYDLEKEDFQKQYNLALENNLPIIIMEPIRGGFLARTVPKAMEIIENAYGENSSARLALSYALNLKGVMLVLSGMSDIPQLEDNINTFKNPIIIDTAAEDIIKKVLIEIDQFAVVDCTKCEYCLPCPQKINIPEIFEIFNKHEMFKSVFSTRALLNNQQAQPSDCIGCKKCEEKCPQSIEIVKWLGIFSDTIKSF